MVYGYTIDVFNTEDISADCFQGKPQGGLRSLERIIAFADLILCSNGATDERPSRCGIILRGTPPTIPAFTLLRMSTGTHALKGRRADRGFLSYIINCLSMLLFN